MSWPVSILPDSRPRDQAEDMLWRAVQELQRIAQGDTTLAGFGDEERPNVDTGVVEHIGSQDAVAQVYNPLDREPVGVVPIIASTHVSPRSKQFSSALNVTASGTTITCSSSSAFNASMALGYVLAQSVKAKIASVSSANTITLAEPWPGSTSSAVTGTVMYHWDADYVWLTFDGSSGEVGIYRLMFF